MIALGCDHGGYELKQEIKKYLDEKGIEYKDYGCDSLDSVDYPIYAKKVAHAILDGECEKGILICGTGIGISITANKIKESELQSAQIVLQQRLQDFTMMPISLHLAEEW